MKKGFTLIELLIVVAIIGILAAIAVPNFLNAQIRAKVARAKAELRNLATALESYYVDNEIYMTGEMHCAQGALAGDHSKNNAGATISPNVGQDWLSLTSPISYVSSIPFDPFDNAGKPSPNIAFDDTNDVNYCVGRYDYNTNQSDAWILASNGPAGSAAPGITIGTFPAKLQPGDPIIVSRIVETDYLNQDKGPIWWYEPYQGVLFVYDPSNGTTSGGLIVRTGP